MINFVYRLVSKKQIRVDYIEESIEKPVVVVRPTFLSICAADQRYYQGKRSPEAMQKKLPMALIHEAVGEVVFDSTNNFLIGDKVVLIPNTPMESDDVIKENYLRSSKFRASGFDGFMQNLLFVSPDRCIKYTNIPDPIASLLELISVAMNGMERFDEYSHSRKNTFGVWGDGSLGFIVALILKRKFKDSKVYVIGHNKLKIFDFVDGFFSYDKVPADFKVDHAFECVGGIGSSNAINQIIDVINPQGSIALLGVSEDLVPINTRMILEKGLSLLGNSRSGYEDFKNAVDFLENDEMAKEYLKKVISQIVKVNNIEDVHEAFDLDAENPYKTVLEWNI